MNASHNLGLLYGEVMLRVVNEEMDGDERMKSLNQFWYGWSFWVLTLPRMFMVSVWGIPAAWFLYDTGTFFQIAAVGCILFDITCSWRAPDVVLSKADILALIQNTKTPLYFRIRDLKQRPSDKVDAERDTADRFYFLTQRELVQRLKAIGAMFVLLTFISAYWFFYSREDTFAPQLLIYLTVLTCIGYLSAKGVPLRNKHTLPEAEKPVTLDFLPLMSKRMILLMFGWVLLSPWWWAFNGLLIVPLHHFFNSFDGSILGFLLSLLTMLSVFLFFCFIQPFALIDRKLQFSLPPIQKGKSHVD